MENINESNLTLVEFASNSVEDFILCRTPIEEGLRAKIIKDILLEEGIIDIKERDEFLKKLDNLDPLCYMYIRTKIWVRMTLCLTLLHMHPKLKVKVVEIKQ